MNHPVQLGKIEERKLIILKSVWPKKTLAVKIGELLVELWESKKRNAELYACLSKGDGERFKVMLNPMQAYTVSGAIQEWQSLWASDFKRNNSPCLRVQLDIITIRFYNHARRRAPHAEIALINDKLVEVTVNLTCTEMLLLGGMLSTIVPDYEGSCRQRDVEA